MLSPQQATLHGAVRGNGLANASRQKPAGQYEPAPHSPEKTKS